MNLQELRDIQDRERSTDSIQALPDAFYEEVATYIRELRADRAAAAERADDPWSSPAVARLSDEIRTAEQVATSIYERRLGKILNRASMAAADVGGDVDGLTAEEQRLYEDLVERIQDNKDNVLGILTGSEQAGVDIDEPTTEKEVPETEPPDDRGGDPDTSAETESETADSTSVEEEPLGSHTTVLITDDVGEVFGVDERVYTLHADDVVTLPTENAEALVERGAAEPVE